MRISAHATFRIAAPLRICVTFQRNGWLLQVGHNKTLELNRSLAASENATGLGSQRLLRSLLTSDFGPSNNCGCDDGIIRIGNNALYKGTINLQS